jgi:hypothetical protein
MHLDGRCLGYAVAGALAARADESRRGSVVGRTTLQPGRRWTTDVKPVAGTDSCEAPHQPYHLSGRLHVQMADGQELEAGAGTVTSPLAGHDAWVLGDEPVVTIDWQGASVWATTSA